MPFPVDDRWMDEAEHRLGAKFPPSYREFMSSENGGTIDVAGDSWDLYHIWDKSDTKRLKRTCNDIVRETAVSRSCEGFPQNGVAVAANGCGDQLLFLPNEQRPEMLGETVFMWSHETREVEPVLDKLKR